MPTTKKVNGKKRGRKPKGPIINYKDNENITNNSEDIPIIACIPITIDSENDENDENYKNNNSEVNSQDYTKCFVKQENNKKKIIIEERDVNDIKCWWCKNYFDTPSIGLPENYFKEKFLCIGNFCSFNCALAYNNDLNDDNVWKRTSLLNLLYKQTFQKSCDIIPSPHWKTLKEFGGILTLDNFRSKTIINTSDYTYLHPPLITYSSEIEKTSRKSYYRSSNKKNNKNSKIFGLSDELLLKRSKPLKTTRYSLENTMGLKIKKKKKKKRTSSDELY